MSFIEYILVQLMVLWNHQMILEPSSAFIINADTVDLGISFDQPCLDMGGSFIMALSCNDLPSQHQCEDHIILSHVMRYSNTGFFPRDADNRQVVAVSLAAQGIHNTFTLQG
jgi:hypothetical protein